MQLALTVSNPGALIKLVSGSISYSSAASTWSPATAGAIQRRPRMADNSRTILDFIGSSSSLYVDIDVVGHVVAIPAWIPARQHHRLAFTLAVGRPCPDLVVASGRELDIGLPDLPGKFVCGPFEISLLPSLTIVDGHV